MQLVFQGSLWRSASVSYPYVTAITGYAHGRPSKVSTTPGAMDKKMKPSSFNARAYFSTVRLSAYFEIEYGAFMAKPAALERQAIGQLGIDASRAYH